MAKRRRKKKDHFYKLLFYVLIACGAYFGYEQIGKINFLSSPTSIHLTANTIATNPLPSSNTAIRNNNTLTALPSDKALEQIPQDAVKKGFSVYHASQFNNQDKLILAYASGKDDNPDLGKPHLVVKSKSTLPGSKNNPEEISFEGIQKQLDVQLQGSPRLNADPIRDQQGNQFYLVKTYVKDDILQSVSILFKGKEIAWAKLLEKNNKDAKLASFLEGNTAATQTEVTLYEKDNIPVLKIKRGVLAMKQAKQTYEYQNEYYQWDGNKFVAMGN